MSLGFSKSGISSAKNDELKRHLLACVDAEKVDLSQVAEKFYAQHTTDTSEQKALDISEQKTFCQAVIDSVDRVLEAGDWDSSLFLRNTAKPLKKLREQAEQLLKQIDHTQAPEAAYRQKALADDDVRLYISLFQANGGDLKQWALQLRSIRSHLLGRPVYENEEDVQKIVRQKTNRLSEAYVAVVVKKTAVLSEPFRAPRLDRNGNTLVTLKDGAVSVDNIVEFVHGGKQYQFVRGALHESGSA